MNIPEYLFILSVICIGEACAIVRYLHRVHAREIQDIHAAHALMLAETRDVKFVQGVKEGSKRAIRLTAARLEEEYTKGWDAKTAQMGLNTDLAHRTGNQSAV